jgi:hypothetical protein
MARSKFPKSGGKEAVPPTYVPQPATNPQPVIASNDRSESTTKVEARNPKPPKGPGPKLETVKTEARGHVVPINLDDEIRRLAYLLSERRGFVPGHENEDWLSAEHEVLQRYRQQSA